MSVRADILLQSLTRDSRIIEIGPSFSPVAPKRDGWSSASLDHMTREGLVAKYADKPGIDVDRIEEVDFVWNGGRLSDAVPAELHGSFDVFLASHVIEHTPDLVAFFEAAGTLLKPDGTIILAVPDKRYCFDYFQAVSTTGQVLEAHSNGRDRHTGQRAFDHFAYAVTDGGAEAWGVRPSQGIRLTHELDRAFQGFDLFERSEGYNDVHAWHFVPASFELLMLELGHLGKVDWATERVRSDIGWEFFVWLRRGASAGTTGLPPEELDGRRMALLKRALLENQAQIDWLLANEPELMGGERGPSSWATPMCRDVYAALDESRLQVARLEARMEAEAAAAEARRAALAHRLAVFEASTFWRATAPLRALVDRVRRIGGSVPDDR